MRLNHSTLAVFLAALLLGGTAFLASPARVGAQERGPASDPDAAIASAEQAALRVDREMSCLRDVHRQLSRTLQQMREARGQMRTGSGADVRRDAGEAIRSLRQRLVRLEREAVACREPVPASARSDAPPEGIVYRDPPRDPRAEAVARQNPATRVIERDILLVGNVRALRGEQVDGSGRVDDERVRDAIRTAASGIDRCYEQMVDRGALERGRLMLTFTVTSGGALTHIETEGSTLRNAAFLRCVRSATRRVRVQGGASGGDATFSYTLALPAT